VRSDRYGLMEFAQGRRPADIVFRRARMVNVFTGECVRTDFAVAAGRIVGASSRGYQGVVEIDLEDRYVCPGFIDSHVHLESSMLTPAEFARAVLPKGTTTVIADPHEIANVCGIAGIRYMLEATAGLPLDVRFMLPSCVPASGLETGGATLSAADLEPFWSHPRVLGLGEVMDVEGVLARRPDVVAKLDAAAGKVTDGHAPGLAGMDLNAYVLAGPASDHECVTVDEGLERLRRGMYLMLREGSATRNLKDLLAAVTPYTERRCLLVTDDRHPGDLLRTGHINQLVRLAVRAGLAPAAAIRMATLNAVDYFGLRDVGTLAPGRRADFLVLRNLADFVPERVYKDGCLVAADGRMVVPVPAHAADAVLNTVRLSAFDARRLRLPVEAGGTAGRTDVIGLVPRQIVTRHLVLDAPVVDGELIADPAADLLKLAVIERHRGTGNTGVGLVKGFGLRDGALATSVAHDSHNIVVIGTNDADMALAVNAVAALGGGLAVVRGGRVLESLALPIAGLMSPEPLETVAAAVDRLTGAAGALGVSAAHDPFMTLSFLALAVVPELKLTDRGPVANGRLLRAGGEGGAPSRR
jgi:adenine deaminase